MLSTIIDFVILKKDGIKLVEGAEFLITTRKVEVNDSQVSPKIYFQNPNANPFKGIYPIQTDDALRETGTPHLARGRQDEAYRHWREGWNRCIV